jgi:hypothetical protein
MLECQRPSFGISGQTLSNLQELAFSYYIEPQKAKYKKKTSVKKHRFFRETAKSTNNKQN